jgi:drug/metabolite transporter (DMT)-like permease
LYFHAALNPTIPPKVLTTFATKEKLIHLFLPFCSSVLVIFGLLYLKRAQENGVSTWTCMILLSWTCAVSFPVMMLLGGTMQPLEMFWQPAIIGALFLFGQFFTFLAVKVGDVSIAAPVQGVKVLIVPALAVLFFAEPMPSTIWVAASIAMVGIVFVQATDHTVERSRIVFAVLFALLAALAMTLFDLFIQRWAPAWGAGYFLTVAFGCSAVLSLLFLPLADRPSQLAAPDIRKPLVIGCLFMTLQAIGMTLTLAHWGDATRVNIVYSLRGLWGVILTWVLSQRMNIEQATPNNKIMRMRLIGAVLIAISVAISIA